MGDHFENLIFFYFQHFLRLEKELTSDEYLPSVVFARDSSALSSIYAEVQNSVQADAGISAAAAGFQAVLSTGYQLEMTQQPAPGQLKGASSGLGARPMSDHEVVCLHGKLAGAGVEESLPTVVLVAHYDAFGAAPVSFFFCCLKILFPSIMLLMSSNMNSSNIPEKKKMKTAIVKVEAIFVFEKKMSFKIKKIEVYWRKNKK